MNVMVIISSPNVDGLTAACGKKAQAGAEEAGAGVVMVNLNQHRIGNCHACGTGWGPCRNEHQCQIKDDFQNLHQSMEGMDAFVLITPVYWGEMSESAKAFTDRLRRCEAFKKNKNFLEDKPVISIAAAGGSGNGITSCLTSMERLFTHVKAEKFDFIGVTQKNKNYKQIMIHEAVKEMVLKQKTK